MPELKLLKIAVEGQCKPRWSRVRDTELQCRSTAKEQCKWYSLQQLNVEEGDKIVAAEQERSRDLSVFGLIKGQEEEFPALVTVFLEEVGWELISKRQGWAGSNQVQLSDHSRSPSWAEQPFIRNFPAWITLWYLLIKATDLDVPDLVIEVSLFSPLLL